jgi:hypothetical protein
LAYVGLGKTKKRKAEEMEAGEEGSTGTSTRSTHTASFTKRSRDAAKNVSHVVPHGILLFLNDLY